MGACRVPAVGLAALAVASSALVGGAARADLIPLPDDKPLPIPPILGKPNQEPEEKQPRQRSQPEYDCSDAVSPFVPDKIEIDVLQAYVPVVPKRRDRNGVPGTPPTTSYGRGLMAFDLDNVRAGATRGHALLNAHTWPDGTALGNALLDKLHDGDTLALTSPDGRICYEVTDRVEVRANDRRARDRYYATDGRPQMAIVVCSGKRLGPGEWSHRTMWFASPY
jgi:sortase (surface protein transpeptidase)